MISRSKGKRSQLFTLRLWTEETAQGHTEWRGKLQRVASGETLYFREWDSMLAFLRDAAQATNEDRQHEPDNT